MKFFLTYGTHHFLKTIYEKHQAKYDIYLLDSKESSMLIVEKKGRSLFQSGKAYRIDYTDGHFQNATFAVINNIPVPQEKADVFRFEAKKRAELIKRQAGCLAIRVLIPVKKSDSFIILSMWDSSGDFRRFQASSEYDHLKVESTSNPQQLFTGTAYEKTYSVYREELNA
ncbi:antibiotic biosynthesis monooxygenase family protein [Pueribacillus sp. YX66]|uniref:antibiotic biosynthesis monooxygenase family protein n=1 Tax=Pueribacillus sp. YX66 TaxID=3229242 RepID=UPI00358CF337